MSTHIWLKRLCSRLYMNTYILSQYNVLPIYLYLYVTSRFHLFEPAASWNKTASIHRKRLKPSTIRSPKHIQSDPPLACEGLVLLFG